MVDTFIQAEDFVEAELVLVLSGKSYKEIPVCFIDSYYK